MHQVYILNFCLYYNNPNSELVDFKFSWEPVLGNNYCKAILINLLHSLDKKYLNKKETHFEVAPGKSLSCFTEQWARMMMGPRLHKQKLGLVCLYEKKCFTCGTRGWQARKISASVYMAFHVTCQSHGWEVKCLKSRFHEVRRRILAFNSNRLTSTHWWYPFRLHGKISHRLDETSPCLKWNLTIPVVLGSSYKHKIRNTKHSMGSWNLAYQPRVSGRWNVFLHINRPLL